MPGTSNSKSGVAVFALSVLILLPQCFSKYACIRIARANAWTASQLCERLQEFGLLTLARQNGRGAEKLRTEEE